MVTGENPKGKRRGDPLNEEAQTGTYVEIISPIRIKRRLYAISVECSEKYV